MPEGFVNETTTASNNVVFTGAATAQNTAPVTITEAMFNIDLSSLPPSFVLEDEEGQVVLTKGEVKRLNVHDLSIFQKVHTPTSYGGYDSVPFEVYDCETLEELRACEHNIRAMLQL